MEIYQNLSIESLPNEEWRDIIGYEGLYQVSTFGRVKGLPRTTRFGCRTKSLPERILQPTISKRGYYVVSLHRNGASKTLTIHRIIAKAFIPNPQNKRAIDHIDANRLNNDIDNLRWCTDKENSNNPITLEKNRRNCKKMWANGIFDSRNNTHYRRVAQYTKEGVLLKVWDSIKEASTVLGIDSSSISKVCLGVNPKRRTAGGYIWQHIGKPYIKEQNE